MDVTLRAATAGDAAFLYGLQRAAMQAYVVQTWGQWDEAWQAQYFQQHFFLANIELLPAYQERGIGTQLIKALIAEAHVKGVALTVQVLKVNPARRLYERLGFVITGETGTHYEMRATPGLARTAGGAEGRLP